MPSFASCFGSSSTSTPKDAKQRSSQSVPLVPPATYIEAGCIFCKAAIGTGFQIVHEDETLIAFKDRSPQAESHILIIPRYHLVSTVKDLRHEHIPMLKEMKILGRKLSPSARKMGFHIPPFSSVHHLHLHVLAGKPTLLGRFKYPQRGSQDGKGLSWFVDVDQAISILDKGKRIGLGTR